MIQVQRDAVHHAEAEIEFKEGRLQKAAELWGQVTTTPPPFEEIALRFVEAQAPDALFTFLQARLEALSSSEKAQVYTSSHYPLLSCQCTARHEVSGKTYQFGTCSVLPGNYSDC